MARCPDCNKFVGYDQAEPEMDIQVDVEKDADGHPCEAHVTGIVRLVLNCADCGSELAEANLDVDHDVAILHIGDGEHEAQIVDESADSTDRYDGKPGTPSRYRRHYYGADITGEIKCSCGAASKLECAVEEQASGFEQLN